MKGRNFLKVCSIILVLAGIFMLVAGGLGIKKVLDAKKVKTTEREEALANIQLLKEGISTLEANRQAYEDGKVAYEEGTRAYEAGKSKLATGQTEYNTGQTTLASAKQQYNEGLASYNAGVSEYEAGLTLYNEKYQEHLEGKAKYDSGVHAYQEGQAALEAATPKYQMGKALLGSSVEEATQATAEELIGRLYCYIIAMAAGLIAIITGIIGFSVAKLPSVSKIKGGIIMGGITFLAALVANVYHIILLNKYSINLVTYEQFDTGLQTAAIAVLGIGALVFVFAILHFKNALIALFTGE